MQRYKTKSIVLKRTNYGDVDRIVNFLTGKYGLVSAIAKGVRKSGARMAAGIEPFTISEIEFIGGKTDLATLVSARPLKQYKNVYKDYQRASVVGEMLRLIYQLIEDADEEYFNLAEELCESADDSAINMSVIETWFRLHLLSLLGRQPNLLNDQKNQPLDKSSTYHFDVSDGVFIQSKQGSFSVNQIKAWRVLSLKSPRSTKNIKGLDSATEAALPALRQFMQDNSF